MKIPAIQKDIVAHLKGIGRPETSRALAARFLRIEHGDEETCRRLLAPFLASVPGIVHRADAGWSLARGSPINSPATAPGGAPVTAADPKRKTSTLRDFVALASEGTGPGGSGVPASVSLLPVLAGEECQEEQYPDVFPEEADGPPNRPGEPGLSPRVLTDLVQTIDELPIVCHRVTREVDPLRRLCALAGISFPSPVISVSKLGHLLLGLKPNHAVLDLAQALGMETRGPDDCRGRARLVAGAFLRLVPLLEERGIESVDALLEYQDMPAPPLDLSAYAFTADDLRSLPVGPGVYRFIDRESRIIYVGKAKNLRSRVGSYFTRSAATTAKGRAILERVHRLEFDRVASDLEASLLESALIAEHHPPLNRQFDVHERPAPYGPRLNLVVVLRDAAGARAQVTSTLHMLKDGRYLRRLGGLECATAPPQGPWDEATGLLERFYFPREGGSTGGAPMEADGRGEGVDIDWQLVASFVRRHRDEINVLDIDECGTLREAEERLRVLVKAANAGPDRVVAR
jgi:GIY-YIG catalytic domain